MNPFTCGEEISRLVVSTTIIHSNLQLTFTKIFSKTASLKNVSSKAHAPKIHFKKLLSQKLHFKKFS